MTTLTTTWEIEVEQTYADFMTDRDEARFRARMERLGFDDDEIREEIADIAAHVEAQGERS